MATKSCNNGTLKCHMDPSQLTQSAYITNYLFLATNTYLKSINLHDRLKEGQRGSLIIDSHNRGLHRKIRLYKQQW